MRIMGVRRAVGSARRCRQRVRDGQCHRVDVMRILDTTRIGALRKTRVNTALKKFGLSLSPRHPKRTGTKMSCWSTW